MTVSLRVGIVLTVGVLAAALVPASAQAATILGTPGNDVLYGTSNRDFISGGGGNDVIYGLGGDDESFGGWGNDVLRGGRE
jgi:Ca2+-binding RTX toxin-like protein